jgi:hypothetical protein
MAMTHKIFIDTEFTDFIHIHLISIGMVAESGEEFYAEVSYPDKECSAFVREAVIPLLGRLPDAFCSIDDLSAKITSWLELVRRDDEELEICYDYPTDGDLFTAALDGRVPPWCHRRMVARNINKLLLYQFRKKYQLPEHHALYDARANRYAYRERPEISS